LGLTILPPWLAQSKEANCDELRSQTKFASYRIVGSQLPTVACLIHAEACCVQMFCCRLATFLAFCWTTETATGDWPNYRVSGGGT